MKFEKYPTIRKHRPTQSFSKGKKSQRQRGAKLQVVGERPACGKYNSVKQNPVGRYIHILKYLGPEHQGGGDGRGLEI